ncbi:MAG: elongation factor P [Deltaproteobacteria bacterium]|nr:elongation factor P [Deltaproteobacteria bacterium]
MADVIDTADFRNGLKIEIDGEPFVIVEFQHVKPGKGSAFVRTRYKSLISGRVLEKNFKSGDKVGRPDIEEKQMQFLYKEGTDYHFMDNKTFEQTFIPEEGLGEAKNYLIENLNASVLFFNGKAIAVDVPNSVDLKVVKCDPGVRGDTVSGAMKPATLQTGYTLNVPLFINEGDVLKIDTRSGEYLTRVSGG